MTLKLVVAFAAFIAVSSSTSGQHKHMQMMEILKDSVIMDLMMDHVASDNARRTLMMEKLIYHAVGDTVRMNEMCKMMINDKRMFSTLTTMIDNKQGSTKTK